MKTKKKLFTFQIMFIITLILPITINFLSISQSVYAITENDDGPYRKLDFDDDTGQFLGATDATPIGISYMLVDNWGGNWSDAEKTPQNTEDDLMCWAASASNILEWTGWGLVGGMWNTDQMFQYFLDHWTDAGGLQIYGWDWWFDGTNPSQDWPGWSQVDVAGGNFWPSYNFYNYYHEDWDDWDALSAIDSYLHSGYGVGLAIYTKVPPGGHAITVWGYNYNPSDPTDYYGIWISDSDDYKSYTNPPDKLRYYEVSYSSSDWRWYLQNYFGTSDWWYIGGVMALEPFPSNRPVADAGGPYTGYVGSSITFDASGSTDINGDSLQYRWDFDRDNVWDTGWSTSPMATYTWFSEHTGTVALQVYDGHTLDVDTADVTVSTAPLPNARIYAYAPWRGAVYKTFNVNDDIYCRGEGYMPNDKVDVYLVKDVAVWVTGINLNGLTVVRLLNNFQIDSVGNLQSTLVWPAPLTTGVYDLVADVDQDGYYTEGVDALEDNGASVSLAGMFVIPEVPLGTLIGLVACIVALFIKSKNFLLT